MKRLLKTTIGECAVRDSLSEYLLWLRLDESGKQGGNGELTAKDVRTK